MYSVTLPFASLLRILIAVQTLLACHPPGEATSCCQPRAARRTEDYWARQREEERKLRYEERQRERNRDREHERERDRRKPSAQAASAVKVCG